MLPYRQNIKLVQESAGKYKFTLKVADLCVDNYIVDNAWLTKLQESWQSKHGVQWTSNSIDWFVQSKHVGMPSEHVRIAAWPHTLGNFGRDYRVSRQDIIDIFMRVADAED